jgi:hypothetical protein
MKLLRILLAALLVTAFRLPAQTGEQKKPLELEPADHRAAIRAELLKRTPPGSTTDQVLHFIHESLESQGDEHRPVVANHGATGPATEGSDKKGVRSIKIFLGDYVASAALMALPIPVPAMMGVTAQWAFDKDGKLIDIFVDKEIE